VGLDSRSHRPDVPAILSGKHGLKVMRPDSRIEDILHTLKDPEEFVRGIVGSFIEGRFNRDEAIVRIGVSGIGVAPHYCIEQGRKMTELNGQIDPKLKGGEISRYQRRTIFNGRTHNPILEDQFKGNSWSSATMTFAEVQTLLGSLRADKKAQ
jgi:hypothetical protein